MAIYCGRCWRCAENPPFPASLLGTGTQQIRYLRCSRRLIRHGFRPNLSLASSLPPTAMLSSKMQRDFTTEGTESTEKNSRAKDPRRKNRKFYMYSVVKTA